MVLEILTDLVMPRKTEEETVVFPNLGLDVNDGALNA
jgi:hypothetical protein